jgi:DDE_Tnp_1-associated
MITTNYSCRISPALEQVRELPAGDRAPLAGEWPSLGECLQRVPGPRDPRGVRHSLTSLLLASVAAVLAGARSFAAIGEWIADAPPQVLACLGVRYDPLAGRFEPPDEATIRRVLEAVDASALDAAVGSWLRGGCGPLTSGQAAAGERGGRWPWTARRCAVPLTAPAGRPCTCWRSLTSKPAPC